jgi:hypothetical protein
MDLELSVVVSAPSEIPKGTSARSLTLHTYHWAALGVFPSRNPLAALSDLPAQWSRTAGNRFARDDNDLGPQLGETINKRTAS